MVPELVQRSLGQLAQASLEQLHRVHRLQNCKACANARGRIGGAGRIDVVGGAVGVVVRTASGALVVVVALGVSAGVGVRSAAPAAAVAPGKR